MIKQVYIDNFKIHDIEDSTLPYRVEVPISGLSIPEYRTNAFDKSGADGISLVSNYLGERRITVRGGITDKTALHVHSTLRRNLIAAVAPKRDSDGLIILKELRFVDLDDNSFVVSGDFRGARLPVSYNTTSDYALDFLADGSILQGQTENNITINPLIRGGFTLPVTLPIIFTGATGGSGTATNNGDAPALPTIEMNGPLTNPRVTNETTGDFIALTVSVLSGEQYVIDMAGETIIQGGVTNRLSKKSFGDFFGLAAGANTLTLTTSVSGESGSAVIKWKDAFYGI